MKKNSNIFEQGIFSAKYLLYVYYIGLISAQLIFALKFLEELKHLFFYQNKIGSNEMILQILGIIDLFMIAGLIWMLISGSYQTTFGNVESDKGEKYNSGDLKVKIGMLLVGISSIHLLVTFMNVGLVGTSEDNRTVIIKVSIHLVFVLSTWAMAHVNYLRHKPEVVEGHNSTKELSNHKKLIL